MAVGMDTTSVWRATASPATFAPLRGDHTCDVAVVGGGITGLTTALLLAQAGKTVTVLERRVIGAGSTGNTTAKVSALQGLTYRTLVSGIGEDGARAYAAANQAAVALVRELATSLASDSDPVTTPSYTFAWGADAIGQIREEVVATRLAGLDTTFTETTDLPFEVAGAVRLDDQLRFHPLRYVLALAAEVERLGGSVHEATAALGIDEDGDGATVRAEAGSVRAGHVVVATLLPFTDIGGFFAKAEPSRSYALAAELHTPAPEGMYLSADSPKRSVRPLVLDDGTGSGSIVVEGPSHKTGAESDTVRFYRELEDWVHERFAVKRILNRWSAQDYSTPDSVPFVGRCPRMAHTSVATGFHKWGLSNGTAAAMILRDQILGRDNEWAPTFDAGRLMKPGDAPQLVKQNLETGKHFVIDRLKRLRPPSADELGPGEGGIVDLEGDSVGAYRDEDGRVVAVSLTCTHLGCTVQWNSAERSWDCPCHASRFDRFGAVLEGPATESLTVVEIRGADD